jgi:aspartate aminotransferase
MVSSLMEAYGRKRSCIRELFEFGRTLDPDLVMDFSLGNPSVRPPQAVLDALSELGKKDVHGYTVAPGSMEVRKAVCRHLNSIGKAHYEPSGIIMTCGAAAALCICMKALAIDSSTQFLAQAPYFAEYECFARGCGARFAAAEADLESFQINFPALEALIGPSTQALVLNSPNNPSGAILSESTLRRLAQLLERRSAELGHRIYIISDEPYREIVYDGASMPHIADWYDSTIVCYSYSKSFSLPGDRIGYIAVSDSVDDKDSLMASLAGSARAMGYVCAPSLLQAMVARCADVKPDISSYRENRDLLLGSLEAMGYECVMPSGAFYLFIKSPYSSAKAFSEEAKKHGLLVVPSDDFGCKGFLRISYCVDRKVIERSLPVFEKLLKQD